MDQRSHGEEGRVSKDYDKNADDTGGSEKPHDNFEQWSEQTQLKISKGCSGWPFIKELCSGKDRVKGRLGTQVYRRSSLTFFKPSRFLHDQLLKTGGILRKRRRMTHIWG